MIAAMGGDAAGAHLPVKHERIRDPSAQTRIPCRLDEGCGTQAKAEQRSGRASPHVRLHRATSPTKGFAEDAFVLRPDVKNPCVSKGLAEPWALPIREEADNACIRNHSDLRYRRSSCRTAEAFIRDRNLSGMLALPVSLDAEALDRITQAAHRHDGA